MSMIQNTHENIVIIGLMPDPIHVIQKALNSQPSALKLVPISPLEAQQKLLEAAQEAALIFIQWDGVHSPPFLALRRLTAVTQSHRGRVHIIYTDETVEKAPRAAGPPLDARQSKILGIRSWIKFPDRYMEIESLIYEALQSDGSAKPTHSEHASANTQGPETSEKSLSEIYSEIMSLLPQIQEIPPRNVVEKVNEEFENFHEQHLKIEKALNINEEKPPFQRFAIFHPDNARAIEITKLIDGVTAYTVVPINRANEFIISLHSDVDAAAIWVDEHHKESLTLLKELAESSSIPMVPTALLIPDPSVLQKVKDDLLETFFDAVVVYNRMRIALNTSLKTLAPMQHQPESSRGLLERLRRPFRSSAPPEFQKTATLQVAQALAHRLSQKPGKGNWADYAMIPYLVRDRLIHVALDKLNKPSDHLHNAGIRSFFTLIHLYELSLLTQTTDLALSLREDQKELALNSKCYLKELLTLASLSPQKLLDISLIALKYAQVDDLTSLIKAWMNRPSWQKEGEFFCVCGLTLRLLNQMHPTLQKLDSLSYLAKAVLLNRGRIDFLAAYGETLVEHLEYRYSIAILTQILKSPRCPWNAKLALARALREDHQHKKARQLLDQLMLEAPGNKDLNLLSHGVPKAS